MSLPFPRKVRELWSEIRAQEPFPLVCLATVDNLGARARTLVLRHLDPEEGRLLFFCHRHHDKWSQLQSLGEVCLYGGPRASPFQLRFRCRLSAWELGRQPWWERLSADHRLRLYQVDQVDAPDEFLPLQAEVVEIDLLDLREPIRLGYLPDGPTYREVPRSL